MHLKAPKRLPALAVTLGYAVALAQPQIQTESGVFQVVVVEDLGKGAPASTESLQYSLVLGAETLRLIFENPNDAEGIPPGSRVEVTGRRTRKLITIPAVSSAERRQDPHIRMTAAAPAPKTMGQRKVAVLLVKFQNDQRQLLDSSTAGSMISGQVNSYYQEDSYGNLSLGGDVYGYLTLPINSVCQQIVDASGVTSGFSYIQGAAETAAQNAGINLSGYDTVLLLSPELQTCSAMGEAAATIGGSPGYVIVKDQDYSTLLPQLIPHEIGHNLGLHHARYLLDTEALTYSGTVPSTECSQTVIIKCGSCPKSVISVRRVVASDRSSDRLLR